MIYIANGIYSDASPNEYLAHYGVLGMKWGVRKARQHERNLYRYNMRNGMSKADAKARYRSNMEGVKQYAKANRHSGIKARDIANASYRRANSKIANYDAKLRSQNKRRALAAGLGAGAAALGGMAAYKLLNKNTRATRNIASGKWQTNDPLDKYRARSALTQNALDAFRYVPTGVGLGISAGIMANKNRKNSNREMSKGKSKKR